MYKGGIIDALNRTFALNFISRNGLICSDSDLLESSRHANSDTHWLSSSQGASLGLVSRAMQRGLCGMCSSDSPLFLSLKPLERHASQRERAWTQLPAFLL